MVARGRIAVEGGVCTTMMDVSEWLDWIGLDWVLLVFAIAISDMASTISGLCGLLSVDGARARDRHEI